MPFEEIEKRLKLDKRMFNGGARPNSGMKRGTKLKKTLVREAAALRLTKKIEEKMDELAEALISKALEKDVPALKEAFERGLGKVLEKRQIEMRQQLPFNEEPANNGIQKDKEPQ